MSGSAAKSKQSNKASFSSSFEVYAAVGGDPGLDQVDKLFVAASKTVLNIKSDEGKSKSKKSKRRTPKTSTLTETKVSTEVEVIDGEKLDVYFGSEDGIVCFSIQVTVTVTSMDGDLNKVTTSAENLVLAADLALASGEFMDTLQQTEAPIQVLLMEKAPESSKSEEDDNYNEYDDEYNNECSDEYLDLKDSSEYASSSYDEDSNDVISSSSVENFGLDEDESSTSLDRNDFDGFLEISYREYLQDRNRQKALSKLNTPNSPSTVLDFPSEGSDPSLFTVNAIYSKDKTPLKRRSEPKVKFDSVVRVKNTLARHDMTPKERLNYWSLDEYCDKVLKAMTEKWHKERASIQEMTEPISMPLQEEIEQFLPSTEDEADDEYTYTVSIRG